MKLLDIINEFVVKDISKCLEFYINYFNFEILESDGDPKFWAKLKKDNCYIILEDYKSVCSEFQNYPSKTETSNLIIVSC